MRYTVKLSVGESRTLKRIIRKGTHSSQAFRAAFILLNCDESESTKRMTNIQISRALLVGMRTIDRVKKKYVEGGVECAMGRCVPRKNYDSKINADVQNRLLSLCASKPPGSYTRWTLRLLADKMVELNYVRSISFVSVGNVLRRMNVNLVE